MRAAPLLGFATLLAAAPVAAQDMTETLVACSGLGTAIAVIGARGPEPGEAAAQLAEMEASGRRLDGAAMILLGQETDCAQRFEDLNQSIRSVAISHLFAFDDGVASGQSRATLRADLSDQWAQCVEAITPDRLEGAWDQFSANGLPCGWTR